MIQSPIRSRRELTKHSKASEKEGPPPTFLARLSTPARIFDRSSTLPNFRQSPLGGLLVPSRIVLADHNPGNFRNWNHRKAISSLNRPASRWNEEYLSCRRASRMKTPGWWWRQVLLDNKTSTGSSMGEREARRYESERGSEWEREKKRDRSMKKGHTHCGRGKVEKEEEEILLDGVLAMWSCLKIMAAR